MPPSQDMPTLRPDICVIGAGSAGLSVAAAAAMFGTPVVLVEKGAMGGDCLNVGCVPSKALIAAADRAQAMRDAAPFGILAQEPGINMARVRDHVRGVIDAIAPNDSIERFTALGVKVVKGEARFASPQTVIVGDQVIQARRFVIATGSRPAIPPIEGLEGIDYLTNETIFNVSRRIDHLVVLGAGAVGLELAQAHRRLGARVTVLEMGQALGRDDPEATAILLDSLRREGINVREGVSVGRVGPRRAGIEVVLHDGKTAQAETIEASHLLVATGRVPSIEGLGLEAAGIAVEPDGIRVTPSLRTTNSRVYAVGDCASGAVAGPRLTHVANYHAGIVLRALLFRARAQVDPRAIPRVVYTAPELAAVGLTEPQARSELGSIRVSRWPFAENDRAQAERGTIGHIKVITDRRGRIVGCHIVGHGAGELITPWTMAIAKGWKLRDMAGFVFPYPTLSEISRRAAVASLQPLATNPLIRRIVGFLRKLG